MAETFLRKNRFGQLVATNEQSAEILAKLSQDTWYKVKITQPRNIKHLRKWMALLQAVFPHQDEYPTFERFRKAVKEALGLGEHYVTKSGERYFEADSISLSAMKQAEFEQYYERGVRLILTRILPGVGRADLDAQVHEILEGRKDQAA